MADDVIALKVSRERPAATMSGYLMLLLLLIVIAAGAYLIVYGVSVHSPLIIGNAAWITGVVALFIACGFFMLQPNQGAAITLFGDYRGTDRSTGLRWVLPWMMRKKVSVRANNFISDRIKVNDLRGNHDEVGAELRSELIARLSVAGITVDECGFTHLAYAQEIAGAMLRRQQAQAVVAARKTLVEGAVGMVEMALDALSEKDVVHLDDERRAAMVSNLMVVLCGERDTQPVVNTGTLYT